MDITISVASPIFIKDVMEDGKQVSVVLDLAKVPADKLPGFMAEAFAAGIKIVANNSYNSGGKDTSEADKVAQLRKRVAAWERGEWIVSGRERSDSAMGLAKDAWLAKRMSEGKSAAACQKMLVDQVDRCFGTDAAGKSNKPATFDNYLYAVAKQQSKAVKRPFDEVHAELRAKALEAGEARRKELASAAKEIELNIDELF